MNSPTASRDCPLCRSSNWQITASGTASQIINASPYYDDASYAHLGLEPSTPFTLSGCCDCGFVYASHVPKSDFLDRLYASDARIEDSVRIFARPARAAFALSSLSRLLAALARRSQTNDQGVTLRPLRILDVGCAFAVGTLGLVHTHFPYEVVGVEWSGTAREYLRQEGMRSTRTLEELDSAGSFDGMILNDVLEHVPSPVDFVAKLRRLAHGRTVIWVNVPDFSDWRMADTLKRLRTKGATLPMDLNPWEHLSYFSPATLNALMAKIGARPLDEAPVLYPVHCSSVKELLTSIARAVRDLYRIHAGRYPSQYLTSGLFALDE